MLSRLKTGFRRPYGKTFREMEVPKVGVPLPRLWMALLVLALPFFAISADYFESLERTGTAGAIIADATFSAMLVGYLVLLFVLKQRRI